MSSGNEITFITDELNTWLPTWWPKDKKEQISAIRNIFLTVSRATFDHRMRFYLDQLKRRGFFTYDQCQFYPGKKIVFKGREFQVGNTKFFRLYWRIEMRSMNDTALDKVKRQVSAMVNIPGFDVRMDTDVLYCLLEQHFGLRLN